MSSSESQEPTTPTPTEVAATTEAEATTPTTATTTTATTTKSSIASTTNIPGAAKPTTTTTTKNEPVNADDQKRLQAQLGNAKEQDTKFVGNEKNQKLSIDHLKKTETLYIKNCEDCEYTVDSRCTKILLEGLKNTKVILNGGILTNIVELWKSENVTLVVNTKVATLQVDVSRNINLDFRSARMLSQVIWAGVYNLDVLFRDKNDKYHSGFDEMKEKHTDINDQTDQFIMRFVEGAFTTELIVRLPGGFPTTNREADAFDERKKKNDLIAEKHIRKLIKTTELAHGKGSQKVGRNDVCPRCKSGLKYKKCCGKNEK